MSPVLHIPSFGGGVVRMGSADTRRTDEMDLVDSYDIGERGQLIVTSDTTPYVNAMGLETTPLSPVYAIDILAAPQAPRIVCVGDFTNQLGDNVVAIGFLGLDGAQYFAQQKAPVLAAGPIVTTASLPYVNKTGAQLRLMLVAIAARPGYNPQVAPGLFVVTYNPVFSGGYSSFTIKSYDALGTGPLGSFGGGTKSKQLYPRGVVAYNGHALAWGFDNHDTVTGGDGPNRVMFSNINNPLKWGFDPQEAAIIAGEAPETDRTFEDSDAVVIGGAGEVIRAAVVWAGKAWFGTNRGLHYMEGFGRESFLTNGTIAIRKSKNVIGAHAFIEGPDGLLHGVGDEGHWIFDGGETAPAGDRLRDFDGKSNGYWDLIWTDDALPLDGFPGKSNADLVWMLADTTMKQVLIGVPFCNAATGRGSGGDTVIIKYHVKTGGYSRQVFTDRIILSGVEFKREQTATGQTFFAGYPAPAPGALGTNVVKYRERSPALPTPVLPVTMPNSEHGEYAPHGPDGLGVSDKLYVTLAWESAFALPITFEVTPVVDGNPIAASVRVTVGPQPGSNLIASQIPARWRATGPPRDGDLWLDTSGTDPNLGNGTGGAMVAASPPDYILRQYVASWGKWVATGDGGMQGTRATIPIAFTPSVGTRVKYRMPCLSANGRYQIEGIALSPATIRSDK